MKLEIDEDGNPKLKAILVGEAGVGKTNLINVTLNKDFNDNENSSVNASFSIKKLQASKKQYNIYLWDTMGQERLRSLTKIFFKNSKIVILVFDITNRNSFNKLSEWEKLVKDNLGEDIIFGICGNKSDLFLKEAIPEEECQKYAESINAKWAYTSAKTDKNGFTRFLKELLQEYINLNNKKVKELKELEKNQQNHQQNTEKVQNPDNQEHKKIVLKRTTTKDKKKKKGFC